MDKKAIQGIGKMFLSIRICLYLWSFNLVFISLHNPKMKVIVLLKWLTSLSVLSDSTPILLLLLPKHIPHLHQRLPQKIQPPILSTHIRICLLKPNTPNGIKRARLHKLPLPRRQQRLFQRSPNKRNIPCCTKIKALFCHSISEF